MSDVRAAVVGGGVAGLAAAAALVRRGVDVCVLEKGEIAGASSSLSAGVYSEATYTDELNLALRTMAIEALRRMRTDRGLVLHEIGFLRLARDRRTLEQYEAAMPLHRRFGIEDSTVLDRAQIQTLIPYMDASPFDGGLWGPRDGCLDGYQLCMTYLAQCREAGVDVRVGRGLVSAAVGVGGRHRLTTSAGEQIDCDVVVNAAGSWGDRVARLLGTSLDIIPQRHQICVVRSSEPFPATLPEVMDHVPGTGQSGLWFRQESADTMLAGLHSNDVVADADREDPDSYARGVDGDYEEALVELLLERLPGLDMSLQSGWSGLYPLATDGQFVVGPAVEDPSVFYACGTGGVGVNTSPAIGMLVADWVVDGKPSIPEASTLAPARFASTSSPTTSHLP